jgi:nucleoside-diphosphate-sugar epimerase
MVVKTVAFMGASTGIGLSALRHTLAAGHRCIALCRNPSKLTAIFPPESTPNLKIIQGNAHDVAAVSQCLTDEDGQLVDAIISTVGGAFIMSKMTLDDVEVCRKGMSTLLDALDQLRKGGATGRPYIVVCSTTGMSRFGRDTPFIIVPLYQILLKVPHADKKVMEDRLAASNEDFTIVRATWLVNGETTKKIRVGIEDPKSGPESKAIGYTISREDAGKWIAENLVLERDAKYLKKIATITY